jgi:NAD(P)-dependent dehydrogenase (short-subunit alcohol dehydrogenase family)
MRLENKRVLVVGASAGLGRASALAIAAEGAQVGLAARRVDRLREAVESAGPKAFDVRCDVRDERSCTAAVDEAVRRLGGLDALVYAPAVTTFAPVAKTDAESWRAILETNLVGASLVLAAAIEALEASRGKAVVFSSIVIDDSPPRPHQAAYVTSKVALETLIEAWQAEHRSVGFTTLANGDAITELGWDQDLEAIAPVVRQWQERGYMFGRMMSIEAVAEQVVNALASSETVRRIAITPTYA